MKEEVIWQKYSQVSDQKAERREKKKRKRMSVSGKSVFGILKQKIRTSPPTYRRGREP